MKLIRFIPLVIVCGLPLGAAAADDTVCGTLTAAGVTPAAAASAAASPTPAGGFRLREGEPVDLSMGGKTVHGTLHMYVASDIYRAYWQPQGSAERYVFADAGTGAVRLISTPPQGVPASGGKPGTTLGPLPVVSCPTL
jgi:hypothetical protein